MNDNFVVVGLGLFGSQTAIDLHKKGKTVFAIDNDASKVEAVADQVTRAITADATDRNVLLQLGIDKCDCAVVGTSRDLAASVLITMNLKAIGIERIICKAQNERNKEVLETLGATEVIIPELVAGDKLSTKLVCDNVVDYFDFVDGYSIVEFIAPESWFGKTLRETNARAKYGINIIAIKDSGKVIASPGADYIIEKGSSLIIMGDEKSIDKLNKL